MFEPFWRFLSKKEILSDERAKLVAYFTDSCALIYHVLIFFLFLWLGVEPMAFYNIFSVFLFSTLLIKIKPAKSFVPLYTLAAIEVFIHQILADYFLGSYTCFHYFILLMGLLPFLIIRTKFSIAAPFTAASSILFIILENMNMQSKYDVEPWILSTIRILNITITVFMIVFMIMIFTHAIFTYETNLQTSNDTLLNEIKMASTIQQNFFKQDTSDLKNYDVIYYSKPMAGVSGDIYDFYKSGTNLDGLGIFDISGHGISSGLVTMLVKNIIHQEFYKNPDMDLWEIMNKINDRVIEEKGDIENYLTGILVRVKENRFEICSAGHPMPIIYHHQTGKCEILKQNSKSSGAIGIKDFPVFYNSEYFDLEPDDEIILYSDGVTDVSNEDKEKFGMERFIRQIERSGKKSVTNQMNDISEAVERFRGSQIQSDDITVIIVKNMNYDNK